MKPPAPTPFSLFIKARLAETGLTQEQFAAICGYSQSYVSRILSGVQSPNVLICRMLDAKLPLNEIQRTELYHLAAEVRGFKAT